MNAGESATLYYPLPWATDPADNHLISPDEMHSLLGEIGFVTEFFEDASESQMGGSPSNNTTNDEPQHVPLSLSTYVDDLALKAENATRSLQEGQIQFIRAVYLANK